MEFAKIDANENVLEYPVSWSIVRNQMPNVALPAGNDTLPADLVAALGYVIVTEVAQPSDPAYAYELVNPVKDANGVWNQTWQGRELTGGEMTALKTALKLYARDYRDQIEAGGLTTNGITIASDAGTQNSLYAARVIAKEQGAEFAVINRLLPDGTWVSLDGTTVIAVADALFQWSEDCFSAQKSVSDLIDSGSANTVAEVESTFDTALATLRGA